MTNLTDGYARKARTNASACAGLWGDMMNKFTVIDVKTQPNIERIKEYAQRYGMTLEEAIERKRIGGDYFPIRDQEIVSVGILNFVHNNEDKASIMATVFTGEEKKVLDATAEKLEKIVKATGKPFFITGDGRKYALELLAGRAMAYMIEAKKEDQEISPELQNMIRIITNPKHGYLKPFDTRDSIDMQAVFGLGNGVIPLPKELQYKNEDLPRLAEETKRILLDMTKNYACYIEAQGEKMKPVIYKLDEKIFKTAEIFEFEETKAKNEEEMEEKIDGR